MKSVLSPKQVLCHRLGHSFLLSFLVPLLRVEGAGQFLNGKKLIGGHITQNLMNAGRPSDFDVGEFDSAEAEMEALVVRGKIAASSGGKADLAVDLNASAETERHPIF